MSYSVEKIKVMQHLGTGLSVDNLCKVCELSYNQLCELAQDHLDLYNELKKWYKRFDFIPKAEAIADACEKLNEAGVDYTLQVNLPQEDDNSLETKENTEIKPKKTRKKVVKK